MVETSQADKGKAKRSSKRPAAGSRASADGASAQLSGRAQGHASEIAPERDAAAAQLHEESRPPVSDRHLEKAIGERTRELRLDRGLTLAELASRVGIGKAMLSKIENAQTSCSLATLSALAEGLDVPVSVLVRDADVESQAIHVMAGDAPTIARRGSELGYQYQLLGALMGRQNVLEPLLVTLTEDSRPFPMFQHSGTEFIYILEGSMEYVHGDATHFLKPGDSLLFGAEALHGASVLHDTPVRFLSVFTYRQRNSASSF